MATVSNTAAPMTVALLPGKPESKMRLADIQKKERQAQKEHDKKIDAPQQQQQSSTVVNISAKARELSSAAPVGQTSSAVNTGNSNDQVAKVVVKDREADRAPPVVQPLPAVNVGSAVAHSKKA